MQIRRKAELVATPWLNGRGVTRDVARRTAADGSLVWLLSIADLTEDAPFSHYENVDRVFTLLEGDPVDLLLDGRAVMTCRPLVPAAFPGDHPTRCRLSGSAARAFNLFAARPAQPRVSVSTLVEGHRIETTGTEIALHVVSGEIAGADLRLGRGDTVIEPDAAGWRAVGGTATIIRLAL